MRAGAGVSDNLYALLMQARQVATTGDAKIFGVEIGIVTNVKDPEKQGRVKVCFPRLPGKPESDWVRVAQPAAGADRGFYWLPQVNDEVLIAFEHGEAHQGYVLGSLWNGKDAPMSGAYTDDNTTQMIQTKSGHQIIFDDAKDAEKIVIADKSGKRALTFDVKNQKLLIEASEGDVEVRAAKKIVLVCEDIEVKTKKAGKVEVGTTFDLKVAQKAQIQAGPRLDMKASTININPSILTGAAVSAAAAAGVTAAAAVAAPAAGPAQGPAGGAAGGGAAGPAAAHGGGGGNLASDVVAPGSAPSAGGRGAPQERKEVVGPSKRREEPGNPATQSAEVGPRELAVQLFNAGGAPQKDMEVELTVSGKKHAGKTDANGIFKLSGLSQQGNAHLEVPDVQVDESGPAKVAGRVRYVVGGIDVPIGRQTAIELPPRVRRCRLSGLNFETNKTFLLPQAMTGIRQLVKLYTSFEGIQGLVNGHTDRQPSKSGDPFELNRKLSVERAEAIAAYLTDDVDAWQKFYAGTGASSQWGVREDQLMLSTVRDANGAPFYDGEIDGKAGAKTKAAYRSFQRSRLIDERDTPNAETRRELMRAYMKLDGTSLASTAKLEFHGCGQTHPLPETESDPNPNQPKNRRVEVYLFDGEVDPKPVNLEPRQGCGEHAKWVGRMVQDVDLDQPPGALKVRVVDEKDEPVGFARVHASGPLPLDRDGPDISFDDLVPGTYKVIAIAEGFFAADRSVDVPAGGAAEAKLTLQTESFDLDVLVEDRLVPSEKLEGAEVSIAAPGAQPQTTGPDGVARFKKLPKGKFTVTARHARFEEGSISVEVPFTSRRAPAEVKSLESGPNDNPPPPGNVPVIALNSAAIQLTIELFPAVPHQEAPDFKNPNVALSDGTKAKKQSVQTFLLSLLPGKHILKVDPDTSELSTGVAGVATGNRIATAPEQQEAAAGAAYRREPQYLLRPFEVEIEVDRNALKSAVVKPPVAGVPPHASAKEPTGLVLKIDWRPDWFKRVLKFDSNGIQVPNPPIFFRRQKRKDSQGRPTNLIDQLVLHQTGTDSTESSVRTLAISQTKHVAAHYIVCPDGHVIKVVHESLEAVHADGFWQFDTGFAQNDRSIGIEIVHGDSRLENPHPFTAGQYASLTRLLDELRQVFPDIPDSRVVAHSDVEPPPDTEKENDPGPMFQWHKLQGVRKRNRNANVQKPIYGIADGGTLDKSNADAVKELQEDLAAIGYLVQTGQMPGKPSVGDVPGKFGPQTQRMVTRFQKRFMSYNTDDGDSAAWPEDAQARQLEFKKLKPRFSGTVDLSTAEAIKQVLADGPARIRKFRTREGKVPLVQPGQSVELSWFLEGGVRSARINPGDIDALALTRNGRGTTTVQARAEDAKNGVVTFTLSINAAPPAVKLGVSEESAPDGDGSSSTVQAAIAHTIPARNSAKALTGSAFMEDLRKRNIDFSQNDQREAAVLEQMRVGSIPDFMRKFVEVACPEFNSHTGRISVSPDYLAVGTDDDFVRFPLTPRLAQKIQSLFGTTFPTRKIVDILLAFDKAKKVVFPQQPAEAFNAAYVKHNKRIEEILEQDAKPVKRDRLVVGHKKDVILSGLLLNPAPADLFAPVPHGSAAVVIYGALKANEKNTVQDESDIHGFFYVDYSHGIRLVSENMIVDDTPAKLLDVLRDETKFGLVVGVLNKSFPPRYPGEPRQPLSNQVRLDEPGVEKGASETARSWAGNKAIIAAGSVTGPGPEPKPTIPSPEGVLALPSGGAEPPNLVRVERVTGGGLPDLRWRTVPANGAPLPPGTEIQLHTRLRNSIWTATGSLVGNHMKDGRSVIPPLATRLAQLKAGLGTVDDVSVYDTHSIKVTGKQLELMVDPDHPAVTEQGYKPFVSALHGMGIQVHAGLRFLGPTKASTEFLGWLRSAEEAELDAFGADVLKRLENVGFDGFGVDFEDEKNMVPKDEAKVTALLRAVAQALQQKGKVLTIAAGVFGKENSTQPHQQAQPPDIAQGFPNIIFRPMSYRARSDASDQSFKVRFTSCADAVLAKLHPSQVQMAVNESGGQPLAPMSKELMSDVCQNILRPRRVGCIYWMLGAFDPPKERLEAIESALNTGEAARGTPHQPLQAPLPEITVKP